jgi:ABC-type Na+ efflux pump permease subunit
MAAACAALCAVLGSVLLAARPAAARADQRSAWHVALRLRTLSLAFTTEPLLQVIAWLVWLVLVIGWFADDSGVIVPAAALPFAAPLVISMAASVSGVPTVELSGQEYVHLYASDVKAKLSGEDGG